jgi:transcription elongation factor
MKMLSEMRREIRQRLKQGETLTVIAKDMQLSIGTASRIRDGKCLSKKFREEMGILKERPRKVSSYQKLKQKYEALLKEQQDETTG